MTTSQGSVPPEDPEDQELRSLLGQARTIAVVGLSSNPKRHSNDVAGYLQSRGYRILPVNPNETEVLGEPAYPSLREVPVPVDVVNVFRRSEAQPDVARDAVAVGAKVLWIQGDDVNDEASRIAEEGGLRVVMGVCLKTTHRRLMAKGAS